MAALHGPVMLTAGKAPTCSLRVSCCMFRNRSEIARQPPVICEATKIHDPDGGEKTVLADLSTLLQLSVSWNPNNRTSAANSHAATTGKQPCFIE
ncbi:MAG: hypothetical protein VB858_18520 [Planctomycetaceae bacterium]